MEPAKEGDRGNHRCSLVQVLAQKEGCMIDDVIELTNSRRHLRVELATCLLHSTPGQVIQLPPNEALYGVKSVQRLCSSLPARSHGVVGVATY